MTNGKRFPARLGPPSVERVSASGANTIKKIADNALAVGAESLNNTENKSIGTSVVGASARTKGSALTGEPDYRSVRARMVQKLETQGIRSAAVLAAMGKVERHRFVDSGLVAQAYEDTSLPIGLGQTISKPSVIARMAELLLDAALGPDGRLGRVLEIGTGCGYQAAVLAELAREVYSIERLRALHDKARVNLRPMRLPNLHLIFGDGMAGFASGAPYSGIISAAGGGSLPDAWGAQLAVGARLVAPVVQASGRQALIVVQRDAHGLQARQLEDVHFVPLKSGIA